MNVRPAQRPHVAGKVQLAREVLSAAAGISVALATGAALMVLNTSAEFGFTITALTGLCGLMLHEVFSRRRWEAAMTSKLEDTAAGQHHLAQEIARTREDVATLKDGLAETAAALEAQERRLPQAAASIESRMLRVITQRLSALGHRQKKQPEPVPASDDVMLELQSPPPPLKPTPVTRLEEALNPRSKKFSDAVIAEMVRHAVRQQKVEMFVQPVVSLPQRKVKMVELFGRIKGRSGIYLPAERYLKPVANDQLLPTIDNRLLSHALEALRSPTSGIPADACIVLNIESATLRHKAFMKELTDFLARDKSMARRIVFELPQREVEAMPAAVMPIVEALSQLGCRFSMDGVRRRRFNLTRMKKLRIRFVKLDAAWLVREANSEGGVARVTRLKKQLDAAGIDLIVERIESEETLRTLLDFDLDYGQGFLFGKPDLYAVWRDRQKPGRQVA